MLLYSFFPVALPLVSPGFWSLSPRVTHFPRLVPCPLDVAFSRASAPQSSSAGSNSNPESKSLSSHDFGCRLLLLVFAFSAFGFCFSSAYVFRRKSAILGGIGSVSEYPFLNIKIRFSSTFANATVCLDSRAIFWFTSLFLLLLSLMRWINSSDLALSRVLVYAFLR